MLRAGSGPSELPETGDPGAGLLRLLQSPSLLKETATPVDLGWRQPHLPAPFARCFPCEAPVLKETRTRWARRKGPPLLASLWRGAERSLECGVYFLFAYTSFPIEIKNSVTKDDCENKSQQSFSPNSFWP